jgi:hypothetical protein
LVFWGLFSFAKVIDPKMILPVMAINILRGIEVLRTLEIMNKNNPNNN